MRHYQRTQAHIILSLLVFTLIACGQPAPQGSNAVSGVVGQAYCPPVTAAPSDRLPKSFKGYTLQSCTVDGEWYFTLAVGLNAVGPCEKQDPFSSQDNTTYTVKGVDSLKELLDQLQPGEYVTWCDAGKLDAGVKDEVTTYGEQKGIQLSIMSDLEPRPTMPSAALTAPDPTATIDIARKPDPAVTTSAVTPDNSLWYAFDEFDEIGGSPPNGQYQGLYRLKNGEITHFDIPTTIRVLEVGPDGGLYAGAGCGVMRFRDEAWQTLLEPDCDLRGSVAKLIPLDIAFAEDGTMWVGGAHSLASFRDGSWTELDISAIRVATAPDGTVWARGWDGRANSSCCVTHIAGSQWMTYTWSADIPAEAELLSVLFDRLER